MNIGSLLKSGLAVALLCALAGTASAVTCTYENGILPPVGVMPLQVSAISVGRDVAVGTVVYRQRFRIANGQAAQMRCANAFGNLLGEEMTLQTPSPLLTWTTGSYAGKVYATGIPGLGVAIDTANRGPAPLRYNQAILSCNSIGCVLPFDLLDFELILIKVGEVTPGVLRGESLPVVSMFSNFGDARTLGFRMGIGGALQIASRTCSTPDVNVPMGTHLPRAFTGTNSATAWTNFSISLNNCPGFNGTVTGSATWVSQGGTSPSGTGSSGTSTSNSVQYRIDSVRAAINPATGVLGINPAAAGRPPAATGIGVQVANQAGPLRLATMQNSGLILSSSEGSYTIPLRARYIQTGNRVTTGPAAATATFTISYQ